MSARRKAKGRDATLSKAAAAAEWLLSRSRSLTLYVVWFVCSSSPLCFALYFTTRCCMVHISLILITNALLSLICFNFFPTVVTLSQRFFRLALFSRLLCTPLLRGQGYIFFFFFLWWSLLTKFPHLAQHFQNKRNAL